jgi:hypothetical protein
MNIDMTADPNYTTGGNITGWRFDWSSAAGVTMDQALTLVVPVLALLTQVVILIV